MLEEQFDLPTCLIHVCHFIGGNIKTIGDDSKDFLSFRQNRNESETSRRIACATTEHNLLVANDCAVICLWMIDYYLFQYGNPSAGLLPCDEEVAIIVQTIKQFIIKITSINDIDCFCLIDQQFKLDPILLFGIRYHKTFWIVIVLIQITEI